MKFLLPITVLLLMLSVGMSLRFADLIARWRALAWGNWMRLLLATFILPPLLALAIGQLLPINRPTLAGLFLVSIAPGAPLMTRNVARKGFDMTLAASYQVWGALMIPIMIPLLVAAVGKLYDRDIWVPPLTLLAMIAKQQFLPLLAGMALRHFAPAFCTKVQRGLNIFGNVLFTVVLVALLWKLGPALLAAVSWVFVSALLLAFGCLGVSCLLLQRSTPGASTLAISNVNRHVGLALLLSGSHFQNAKGALPVIAAYALAAPLAMALYTRWQHRSSISPTTI